MTRVNPIINITETVHTIPSSILNVPPICSSTDTIFLSAIGWLKAAVRLKENESIINFIIGIIHIESTTNMPDKSYCIF